MIATVVSATQRWPASAALCPCSLPPRRSNAPHPLVVGSLFLPPKFHARRRHHFWSALTCQRFRKRRSRACPTALQSRLLSLVFPLSLSIRCRSASLHRCSSYRPEQNQFRQSRS